MKVQPISFNMPDFKFKPGDRVAERPRVKLNVASSSQGRKLFNQHGKQRYGTVTAISIRVNARNAKRKIVSVQWDGLQQSCDHEQMRLCAIDELAEATQSAFNGHSE